MTESYPRVTVGTDGSDDATAAVRIAGRIASSLEVPVDVISVWQDEKGPNAKNEAWATRVTTDAVAILEGLGVSDVSGRQMPGDPADVLVDYAVSNRESLIVVGSAGLTSTTSRLTGSTSNKLAHHSPADVLYARDPAPKQWNFVALATDGSETSLRAVRRGLELAKALEATPRLVTAAKSKEDGTSTIASTIASLGVDADSIETEIVVDSQAASAIILQGWKYEIVVIGNKSMSGASRLLGSIANKITHGIETNLLLVNTTR